MTKQELLTMVRTEHDETFAERFIEMLNTGQLIYELGVIREDTGTDQVLVGIVHEDEVETSDRLLELVYG